MAEMSSETVLSCIRIASHEVATCILGFVKGRYWINRKRSELESETCVLKVASKTTGCRRTGSRNQLGPIFQSPNMIVSGLTHLTQLYFERGGARENH